MVNEDPTASLVVLDDADLGFRSEDDLWPAALKKVGDRPWLLVKKSRPVAQGEVWEHLSAHQADRLIAVMTVNDLRLTEV